MLGKRDYQPYASQAPSLSSSSSSKFDKPEICLDPALVASSEVYLVQPQFSQQLTRLKVFGGSRRKVYRA